MFELFHVVLSRQWVIRADKPFVQVEKLQCKYEHVSVCTHGHILVAVVSVYETVVNDVSGCLGSVY